MIISLRKFLINGRDTINDVINTIISLLLVPSIILSNVAFYTDNCKILEFEYNNEYQTSSIPLELEQDSWSALNIQGIDRIGIYNTKDYDNIWLYLNIEGEDMLEYSRGETLQNMVTWNKLNIQGIDMILSSYEAKNILNDKTKGSILYDISDFIINDTDYTMYVNANLLNVRELPYKEANTLGKLMNQEKIRVIGEVQDTPWVKINYKDQDGFVHKDYIVDSIKKTTAKSIPVNWGGGILNRNSGRVTGPSGKETYYNLNMSKVVANMQRLGYPYSYWEREDGVKMFGNYVIVAANLQLRPRGTILPTSLGMGIVCDTGEFAKTDSNALDLAVTW